MSEETENQRCSSSKPKSSNLKLQINLCCLKAKHYIWISPSKELYLTRNNFLIHLNYTLLRKQDTEEHKKWKPFVSLLDQVS